MKEFIDKLIERLEGIYNGNDKLKKEAYEEQEWERFDFFTHENGGIYIAISIVNKLAEEYNNDFCEWKQYDENDIYYTRCEQIHMFIDGGPTDNKYEYCPYCGKRIKVAPYTEGE